jgi:hypothetical protein
MTKFKLINVWTAERTLPVLLTVRLIAMFRFTGRPHAFCEPGSRGHSVAAHWTFIG